MRRAGLQPVIRALILAALIGAAAALWTWTLPGASETGAPSGAVVVQVLDNGFHTDLAVPRAALMRRGGPLAQAVARLGPGDWILIGWGDARFYVDQSPIVDRLPDGARAYDLARDGVAFELPSRRVTIHSAEVSDAPDADHVELTIRTGKGVYVRSLARDLAAVLGAEGHVSALRRERVGPFSTENAVTLDSLEEMVHRGAASEGLLAVATALDDIPELAVTDQDAFSLRQGRPIVLLPRQVETLKDRLSDGSRTVSAFQGQTLVALCQLRAGRLEPDRVFNLS